MIGNPARLPASHTFPLSLTHDIFDGFREIAYTRGMAEPVRRMPPAPGDHPDDEPGITLIRWVKSPDGSMEQVELRLTPELFLNPQLGDKWMQGTRHWLTGHELFGLLNSHFRSAPDVLVTADLAHLLGPGLGAPTPDVSVIFGVRNKKANRHSFSVRREGVRPQLIIEVVSPLDSQIRKTDLERKVEIYRRGRVSEYVIVDSTLKDPHFRLLGYRLDESGRYSPIEPDAEGRLLSETTRLWFQVSPDGERVFVFEHPSGERLLNFEETAQAWEAAERHAEREAQAREAAEAEVARMKAEIERLRRGE